VTILAEVVSGDTPLTLTLVVLVIGAVGAYVGEKVSTRHRLKTLEDADEKHEKASAACQAQVSKLTRDVDRITMILNPPRSGSWPVIGQQDDRG
jgi:hypothetical protein